MAHWCNTWPHKVMASVILKDNKIKYWKVGQYSLKEKYDIKTLIETHPEYSYQEKEWTVFNDLEHSEVFEEHSRRWFKQWKLHENYCGSSPFENEDFII